MSDEGMRHVRERLTGDWSGRQEGGMDWWIVWLGGRGVDSIFE